jgi:hypothetical protein
LLGSSYASSRSDSTFFHYFAKFTPDSPAKLIRLKTVLFLQGSSLYDAELIREQLVPHSKRVLSLELAIVNGKARFPLSAPIRYIYSIPRSSEIIVQHCRLW